MAKGRVYHAGSMTAPLPASVRYNDWRRINIPPPEAITPALPVSVIVSCYEAPESLARTLAALETQNWPHELFEVVIVDDGSRLPLEPPRRTPLNVTVVRQEDRGFGLARARNTGVRTAAHDILLFLDGDMLPEVEWIAAHARWHHAASGILTLGFRAHVAVGEVTAAAIRERSGPIAGLFADRPTGESWREDILARTCDLTSRHDDLFIAMVGANFGIRRDIYELTGGFDESFTRWGLEDTEFAYRVFTRGGILVPVRDAFAAHQGRLEEHKDRKRASLQRQGAKVAHLIAHPAYRDARPGRIFATPQFVVRIDAADLPADRVVGATETVLADRVHDLIVRIDLPAGDDRLAFLRDAFGPDPRVRVGCGPPVLDQFPASPFHIEVPAGATFSPGIVRRLRRELGPAVSAAAVLRDGSRVAITRAWALHRARRTGQSAGDFGDVIAIPPWRLRVSVARTPGGSAVLRRLRRAAPRVRRALSRLTDVRTPRQASWFLESLWAALRWRASRLAKSRRG